MPSIRGRIKFSAPRPPGIGASATLPKQLPLISAHFPQIANAHPGTINVDLELPLLVLGGYDHRTAPLQWDNNWAPGEVFDLVCIEFEVGGKRGPAWLYIAHGSPHRRDMRSHEVITPAKLQILRGEMCVLHIDKAHVVMPYPESPLVVLT